MRSIKITSHIVHSFTLTEVIIAMVITGIVSYTAYLLLSNTESVIHKEYSRYQKHTDKMICYSTLAYDIAHGQSVSTTSSSITINNEIQADIDYICTEQSVIRKRHHHADTFLVHISQIKRTDTQQSSTLSFVMKSTEESDTLSVFFAVPLYNADIYNANCLTEPLK